MKLISLNSFSVVYFLLIFSFIVGVLVVKKNFKKEVDENSLGGAVFTLFCYFFFFSIISFALSGLPFLFFMTPVSGDQVVLDKNDQAVEHCPAGNLYRNSYLAENNYRVISFFSETIKVAAVVNPITENPKVRKIETSISVEYLGALEDWFAFQKFKQKIANSDVTDRTIEGWLKYQIVEFNEKNSKALATFYNPGSRSQKIAFKKLAKEFFDPLFEGNGLRLAGAYFLVPDARVIVNN